MSLLKHLLLSVSVAIAVMLAGTLWLSVGLAKQYLDGQLQSQSENSVSALSLALSQPGNQDPITRELLMMALFDSGQFRAIRFSDPSGKLLFERTHSQDVQKTEAPKWFTALLPLDAPEAVRDVSDGWRQVGQLRVEVDNAFASTALWQSTVRTVVLLLAAGGVWAFFVAGLLHWFRQLLSREIAAQVLAIGQQTPVEGDAGGLVGRPALAELEGVMSAIHRTSERVRLTAQEHTQRIESLELALNRDAVTQLPNRKYFMNELRRVLQAEREVSATAGSAPVGGHVLLFRQRDLQALNAHLSRAQADAWLLSVAQRIGAVVQSGAPQGSVFARLNGADFVLLLPRSAGPEALHIVQRVKQELQALRQPIAQGQWCRWAYALTDYGPDASVSALMARLDEALMRSESVGQDEVEFLPDSAARHSLGEYQWQHVLSQALSQRRVLLQVSAQSYVCGAQHWQRHEASLALQDTEGAVLQGALFLPVAVRLGFSAAFDLHAIDLAQQWLEEHPQATLVVKVSLPSLADSSFLPKLQAMCAQSGEWQQRLSLELDAHGLLTYAAEMQSLGQCAAQAGIALGLRRLEHASAALTRLHTLPLAYVKLGSELVHQSDAGPGSHHLLQAMLATASSLRLQVYVVGALDTDSSERLQHQGVAVLLGGSTGATHLG